MPDTKNIVSAMALSQDESRVLGLTFGTRKITPGQYIPKAGKYSYPSSLPELGS
jgi:phosphatidylethanolamine-binding protein